MRAFRQPRSRGWKPSPEAVEHCEAWGRYVTRGARADRGGFLGVQGSRFDPDLEKAGIVEGMLEAMGGQRLRWLILHVHFHGRSVESFRAVPPGSAGAIEDLFGTEPAMVLAAYRRFMVRLGRFVTEKAEDVWIGRAVTEPLGAGLTIIATVDATEPKS